MFTADNPKFSLKVSLFFLIFRFVYINHWGSSNPLNERINFNYINTNLFSILIIPFLCFFGTSDKSTVDIDLALSSPLVNVTLEYSDGHTEIFTTKFEDLPNVVGGEDMVECSYEFADGTCNSSQATCADAYLAFAWCACEIGHDNFCDRPYAEPVITG